MISEQKQSESMVYQAWSRLSHGPWIINWMLRNSQRLILTDTVKPPTLHESVAVRRPFSFYISSRRSRSMATCAHCMRFNIHISIFSVESWGFMISPQEDIEKVLLHCTGGTWSACADENDETFRIGNSSRIQWSWKELKGHEKYIKGTDRIFSDIAWWFRVVQTLKLFVENHFCNSRTEPLWIRSGWSFL